MASSDSWRIVVIIFASFILIGGILDIVSDFEVNGSQGVPSNTYTKILQIVPGALYVLIGVLGIIAGATRNKILAALYFFALLVVIVIIIVGYVIAIVLVDKLITESDCGSVDDYDDCDLSELKRLITYVFIVLLAINVACCGLYAMCAGCYWRVLVRGDD